MATDRRNRECLYVPPKIFDKLLARIKTEGVEKVILFGSPRNENAEKPSKLSMIIVQETDKTVVERLDDWYRYLRPGTGLDILVYTPEEIEDLKSRDTAARTALKDGHVLFDTA